MEIVMAMYRNRFKNIFMLFCLLITLHCGTIDNRETLKLWTPHEITLQAENSYENPYKEIKCWITLKGPSFEKCVYGFWDGGSEFKVRVVAAAPGTWTWTSGSNVEDAGLNGIRGGFRAEDWTEEEKQVNPNRRGFLRAAANGHALQYADGTPFFLLADTWYSASTFRFPLKGVAPNPGYVPGPGIGLEEAVQYRKNQGYNSAAIIACFPAWADDGFPPRFFEDDVMQRDAWKLWTLDRPQDMHDDDGNRPFEFPGLGGNTEVVPNYDRINPAYFRSLDKKMQYLSDQGFAPFLEVVRRDHGLAWMAYYDFNESYARYVNYIAARYGCYNLVFSALHRDYGKVNQPDRYCGDTRDWNAAITHHHRTYGPLPYGQPFTVLAQSTLREYGQGESAPWLTIHNVGNIPRDNEIYPEIFRIFRHPEPLPVFNSEPYYPGWYAPWDDVAGESAPLCSPRDIYFARTQSYGSVLSGALAGYVHGSGAFDATVEGEDPGDGHLYLWDGLLLDSGRQVGYMKDFITSEGGRYRELVPANENITPRQNPAKFKPGGLSGQSYLTMTPDRSLVMAYFEDYSLRARISGLKHGTRYAAQWFDPRTGQWQPCGDGEVETDETGNVMLPQFPGELDETPLNTDWALKLVIE